MTHLGKRRFYSPQDGIYTRLKPSKQRQLSEGEQVGRRNLNVQWQSKSASDRAALIATAKQLGISRSKFQREHGRMAGEEFACFISPKVCQKCGGDPSLNCPDCSGRSADLIDGDDAE